MIGGAHDWAQVFKDRLRLQGRQVRVRVEPSWGPGKEDSVFVDFVNLPEGVGAAGGGAEAENNRATLVVRGFGAANMAPPTGKVKIEQLKSHLYSGSGSPSRETRVTMRAKTGTPDQVAKYAADFLNRVVDTVEPRFTDTQARMTGEKAMAARSRKVSYYAKQLGFPEVRSFHQLFTHAEPFVSPLGRDTSRADEQKRRLGIRIKGEKDRHDRDSCGYMVLGPYMSISGQRSRHRSLAVRPAQNLVDWITVVMIFIDCDHLYFDVIVRDRGNALVTVKYNRILGDRWIASIDPKTIPNFGD